MTSYSYKLFLLWHLPPKHDCGKELSGDADNDHDHETLIVEYTEEPTAQEPGSTETALKDDSCAPMPMPHSTTPMIAQVETIPVFVPPTSMLVTSPPKKAKTAKGAATNVETTSDKRA